MKCTKCGRNVKGHDRPWGELCTLTPLTPEEMSILDEEQKSAAAHMTNTTESEFSFSRGLELDRTTTITSSSAPIQTPVGNTISSQAGALGSASAGVSGSAAGIVTESHENVHHTAITAQTQALTSLAQEMGRMALAMEALSNATQNNQAPQPSRPPVVHPMLQTYSRDPPSSGTSTADLTMQVPSLGDAVSPPGAAHPTMSWQPQPTAEAAATDSKVLIGGAQISRKVVESAVRGEYIILSEFLPNPETQIAPQHLEASVSENGLIEFKQKAPKKAIESFFAWLTAFTNLEEILVSRKPEIYPKLVAYRRFIQQCDKKYTWPSVRAYDCRYRAELAKQHSLEYQKVDLELFSEIFDAGALKNTRRCFRCKSYDHVIQRCPFPEAQAMEKEKTGSQTTEICLKYNEGRCNYPLCRRSHMCKQCKGPSPFIRCTCHPPVGGTYTNSSTSIPAYAPTPNHQAYNPGYNQRYNTGPSRPQ